MLGEIEGLDGQRIEAETVIGSETKYLDFTGRNVAPGHVSFVDGSMTFTLSDNGVIVKNHGDETWGYNLVFDDYTNDTTSTGGYLYQMHSIALEYTTAYFYKITLIQ